MAKTTTWTGATDLSSYFTPTNWTNGVPGPGDTEIIPLGMPKATGLHLVGQTVNLTASPTSNGNALFTIVGRAADPASFDTGTVINGGDNQIELDGYIDNGGTIFDANLAIYGVAGNAGVSPNASDFRNFGTIDYNVAPPSDPGYVISGSSNLAFENDGTVNVTSPTGAIATGAAGVPVPVSLDIFGVVLGRGTFNVTGGVPNGATTPANSTATTKSKVVFHGQVFLTDAVNLNNASAEFLQSKNDATVNIQDASSAVYLSDASKDQSGVTITGFRAGDVVGLNTTKVTQAVYDGATGVVDLEEANGQIDSTLTIVAGGGQVLSSAAFAISPSYGAITGQSFLTTTLAAPTPGPSPSVPTTTVAAVVAANLPSSSYSAAAIAVAIAGLSALPNSPYVVTSTVTQAGGPFAKPVFGALNVAINPDPPPSIASITTVPDGYGALFVQGQGGAELLVGGKVGQVVVGAPGPTVFESSALGVTLVGGNGGNEFSVTGGTATVATGDGRNTVTAFSDAAVDIVTGTGISKVTLAGGASTVQSNGQDTVVGGTGTATVTAAKGAVAVGGAGLITFTGGTATSVVFGGKGGLTFVGGSAFDIAVGTTGVLNARAGSGGGEFFGNSGGDFMQSGSGRTIMVLNSGGKAVSTGAGGNYLIAGVGTAVLDGSAATGNDVFFGGTGQDAILCGSGNDLIGTGKGTSTVQLGSGTTAVFASGNSTITAGSGNASIVMGGTVALNIAAGAARSFALFNFLPGFDRISLSGYTSSTIGAALANQVNGNGQTVLTLSDNTKLQLIGVTRVDASFFG